MDSLTRRKPGGSVTAPLAPVDLGEEVEATEASTSGCEGSDFGTLRDGDVALVQRGGCFLLDKAHNAERAGASHRTPFHCEHRSR